jgi:hypothetical protein
MTIEMYCDHCGNLIEADKNGGCRIRLGKKEYSFHLCPEHQEEFLSRLYEFCERGEPSEVAATLVKEKV